MWRLNIQDLYEDNLCRIRHVEDNGTFGRHIFYCMLENQSTHVQSYRKVPVVCTYEIELKNNSRRLHTLSACISSVQTVHFETFSRTHFSYLSDSNAVTYVRFKIRIISNLGTQSTTTHSTCQKLISMKIRGNPMKAAPIVQEVDILPIESERLLRLRLSRSRQTWGPTAQMNPKLQLHSSRR